jgi:hypothetical protein
MSEVAIGDIRTIAGGRSVECSVDFGVHGTHELYFRCPQPLLRGNSAALLAALLLPCMRLGLDIRVTGKSSARLLRSATAIQRIFRAWDARFATIAILAEEVSAGPARTARRRGTFFSGGIDSLYTLARHREEIDDLVLIYGFDIDLGDVGLRRQVSGRLADFAARMGKNLVEIETNVGAFLRRHVGWSLGHGPALASVGLLLSSHLDRLYIPSTHTLADDLPWGSHPDLDALWSTESLEFVHDGANVTRVQKTECVAAWPEAMQCLRVCWKNAGGAYNCGRCEKCLRTMVTLEMMGALQPHADMFAEPLSLPRVSALRLHDENSRAFAREILQDARLNERAELRGAVEQWLKPPGTWQRLAWWLKGIRLRRTMRGWIAGFRRLSG